MWWEGKYVKDQRIHVALLGGLGFALVVGMYQGIVINHVSNRTTGQKIAYLFEAMWEAAFFGFGLGFFCVYGYAIRNVDPGPLRNRCIGIWIAISYFFMSWWPHASVHQFLTPLKPTDYIILEVCFHWPNLVAALVLCYFQFDVLRISHDVAVNNKELRNWSEADEKVTPWYKDIRLHGVIISMISAVGWIIFQYNLNPLPPFIEPWQKGFLITIYITDGCASGIAMGFVYSASILTHRLPKKRTRRISALSIASVAYLLVMTSPHPIVHFHVALHPNQVLVVEYTFHLSITAAVSILAFFQHRFLVLALRGRMGMMMKFKDSKAEEISTEMNSKSFGKSSGISSSGMEGTQISGDVDGSHAEDDTQ